MLEAFLKKINKPELIGQNLQFLYNANIVNFGDKTKIKNLFVKQNNSIFLNFDI